MGSDLFCCNDLVQVESDAGALVPNLSPCRHGSPVKAMRCGTMYCSTDTVAVRTVNVVKPVVLNVVRLAKDAQRNTRRNVSRIVNIGL